MIHERQQSGVFVTQCFPIDAVHRGRKEKIAHLPPAFEVDLVPLGMPIQLCVEILDLVLVVFGLELVLWHIDNGVIFFAFSFCRFSSAFPTSSLFGASGFSVSLPSVMR